MSFGKSVRGRPAPPPLPMYQPVVLKHVPTMVTRRYQHFDVHKLDQHQDVLPNDGEIEDNGDLYASDEDNDDDNVSRNSSSKQDSASEDDDTDRSDKEHSDCIVDTVVKDDTHANEIDNSTNDQGSPSEDDDTDRSDMEHSECIVDTVLKNDMHDNGIANPATDQGMQECNYIVWFSTLMEHSECNVDTVVKDDIHDNEIENPATDQGSGEREDNDQQDSSPKSEVDDGVSLECQHTGAGYSTDACETETYSESVSNGIIIQPTDSDSEHSEIEDGGPKIANYAPTVEPDHEDETQYKKDTDLVYEKAGDIIDNNYEAGGDANIVSYSSFKDEALDVTEGNSVNVQDLHSEHSENEDHRPKLANDTPIVDCHIVDETQNKRFKNLSSEQGFPKVESKGEDKEAVDVKMAKCPSAKDDALDMTEGNSVNGQVLRPEDNKGECDKTEDENPSLCANGVSLNSEAEEMRPGSVDEKQDTLTCTFSEDFVTENLVRNRSFDLDDLKNEGDGTRDMNGASDTYTTVKTEVQDKSDTYSYYEQEFKPEAFKKSVEEDGYELCCPYCKHCLTNTLIFRRREDTQPCRVTCFTSLLALFCCVRD